MAAESKGQAGVSGSKQGVSTEALLRLAADQIGLMRGSPNPPTLLQRMLVERADQMTADTLAKMAGELSAKAEVSQLDRDRIEALRKAQELAAMQANPLVGWTPMPPQPPRVSWQPSVGVAYDTVKGST